MSCFRKIRFKFDWVFKNDPHVILVIKNLKEIVNILWKSNIVYYFSPVIELMYQLMKFIKYISLYMTMEEIKKVTT